MRFKKRQKELVQKMRNKHKKEINEQTNKQPNDKLNDKLDDKSINKTINKSLDRPANSLTHKLISESSDKPVEIVDKPSEKSIRKQSSFQNSLDFLANDESNEKKGNDEKSHPISTNKKKEKDNESNNPTLKRVNDMDAQVTSGEIVKPVQDSRKNSVLRPNKSFPSCKCFLVFFNFF